MSQAINESAALSGVEHSLLSGLKDDSTSHFYAENCLVALLGGGDQPAARTVNAAQFDRTFGQDVGNELRRIGCDSITMNGNGHVDIHLGARHFENVNQAGLNRVRLEQNISFDVNRNGGTIGLSNINGIDLDFGRFAPWVGLPDMNITRGNVELVLPIRNVNIGVPNDLFDTLNNVIRRLEP
jgi:hypothetical protein